MIVTLIERKSGMVLLAKVSFRLADLVAQVIEQRLKPYGSRGGLPWQLGNNDNFNGLMSQ